MNITLRPIDDSNREAVLALTVREDQPFVATNDYSLKEAAETNEKYPGVARPFGIYADDRLVGFCMFAFDTIGSWAFVCLPLIRKGKIRMIATGSGAS